MTQDAQANQTPGPTAASAPPTGGRRWRRGVALALVLLIGMPALGAGALWLWLGASTLRLPAPVSERIAARLDAAMSANAVTIGAIDIRRTAGGGGLDLGLRDLRLTDPDGTLRAAFPALVVEVSLAALRQGRVEPVRVDLRGAGLRLARDALGRIDLDLMADDSQSDLSLAETLARLDRMFASPVFDRLESVQGSALELVMADEMTGQTMRVSDAEMRLERVDGALALRVGGALAGSRPGRIDIALTRAALGGVTDVALSFSGLAARDVATIGPALAWVDLMRAPISGHVGGVLSDDGSVGDLAVQLEIGPGQIRPAPGSAAIGFDALQASLRYEAARGRVVFDRFELSAPDLSLEAIGHADPLADGTGYVGQFRLTDIRIARTDLWPAPLTLEAGMVDFRLALSPDLEIEIGQAAVRAAGRVISARGRVALRPEGLGLALDVSLPEITVPEVMGYWPEAVLPDTRGWLAANLYAGRVSGAHVALRARPGGAVAHSVSFHFDDASLSVLPALPPIEGAAGYLSLVGPELRLRLEQGRMLSPDGGGLVALGGSQMAIADTRRQGPQAQIDLAVSGGLRDVLRLMQEPPIRLFAQGAMTPDRIGDGQTRLRASITTRLMPQDGMGDTGFELSGQVAGYRSSGLVPGRLLEAELLDIALDAEGVHVWGRARLDGQGFEGRWSRPLGVDARRASRLEATVELTRAGLAAFGVDLPAWLLSGQTPGALRLDLPDTGPPELLITSDLAGAGLALPPLGWRQGAAQTGRLEALVRLGPVPVVTRLDLSVGGLEATGRVALTANGVFERLALERFRLGGWLDVTGALVGRGRGRPPAIEITGGMLDLRGAPQTGSGGGGGVDSGPISATLDRLQVTEGIAFSPILADLTTQGGLSGQFRGRVNGDAPVTGTFISTPTGPAVRIRADDGGQVLRSAGIFRSAHGGQMELVLQASGAQGVYDGLLRIDSPRLRDAPVLAEMLNVVSIVGLLDQLGGEGINLGSVEAQFRLTPTQLILTEGVALGAALGLSLDGTYDLASRQLDMAGVLSPLNAVNGLFGAIFTPRREGLFGFAYRLTGPSSGPQVTVNPLSILTPGIFREIFRRPPPS